MKPTNGGSYGTAGAGAGSSWVLSMVSWLNAPWSALPTPTSVFWKKKLLSSLTSAISLSGSTRTSLCRIGCTNGVAKTLITMVARSSPGASRRRRAGPLVELAGGPQQVTADACHGAAQGGAVVRAGEAVGRAERQEARAGREDVADLDARDVLGADVVDDDRVGLGAVRGDRVEALGQGRSAAGRVLVVSGRRRRCRTCRHPSR